MAAFQFHRLHHSHAKPLKTPSHSHRLHSSISLPRISYPKFPILQFHTIFCKPYSFNLTPVVTSFSSKIGCSINTNVDPNLECETPTHGNWLIQHAAWVGVATLTSKILGLLREIVLAAVFGIGPVATAFRYASVLPGFAASLLGGVNGPIHVTMATTLSRFSKERQRKLFQHTNAIMILVGGVVGALVFVFADFFVHIFAPGLWILEEGRLTREIAILQLKIMAPCIALAGPVGLGFGYMSAEGNITCPSFSPALSSILIVTSCICVSKGQLSILQLSEGFYGGILLSCGASLGAFLQWIIQVIIFRRTLYSSLPFSWVNVMKNKDVYEFFSLMVPAIVTSGLAQIASLTDLYFASVIPDAAAGLSCV